jgi:3-hydroxyisobutyrate dehydrogenase
MAGGAVGVIGLGNMGGGMALRLLDRAMMPIGCDRDAARTAALAAAGGRIAASPADAAAPVVLLSLPDAAAVGAVLARLLPALPAGAVIADTSTLDPIAARGFAARGFAAEAAARGCAYLDAPVSGGAAGARAGTLTMMLGGEAAAIERARPVLEAVAARLVHAGPAGAGQVAKLVNNLLVATHLAVSAEALRLGARAGLAPAALLPILNAATGRSAATEVNWPRWIESGAFDSGFTAGLMRKDVRLALGLAEAVGAPLDACAAAAAAWEASSVGDVADFNRVAAGIFTGAPDV